MGNQHSELTEEVLDEYEELTFLTRREIIHAWSVWKKLTENTEPLGLGDVTQPHLRLYHSDVIKQLPELKHNPFQEDVIRVFASETSVPSGEKYFNFDNFLDLLHVMSPKTPQDIKAHFAFQLYDVDGDCRLDRSDLDTVIRKLTGSKDDGELGERAGKTILTAQDRKDLIDKLLEENGIERNSGLSRQEFNFIIEKCPDFAQCFSFTL